MLATGQCLFANTIFSIALLNIPWLQYNQHGLVCIKQLICLMVAQLNLG